MLPKNDIEFLEFWLWVCMIRNFLFIEECGERIYWSWLSVLGVIAQFFCRRLRFSFIQQVDGGICCRVAKVWQFVAIVRFDQRHTGALLGRAP